MAGFGRRREASAREEAARRAERAAAEREAAARAAEAAAAEKEKQSRSAATRAASDAAADASPPTARARPLAEQHAEVERLRVAHADALARERNACAAS